MAAGRLVTLVGGGAVVSAALVFAACQPPEPGERGRGNGGPSDAAASDRGALREELYKPPAPFSETVEVRIGGEEFRLVPALTPQARVRGLGGWEEIPPRGGMIFAFPYAAAQQFVMRDCKTDIDIAYLNAGGRVLTTYTMINQPRRPGESDQAYEQRLVETSNYVSGSAATFVVEVAPGTLERLGVGVGDVIGFDHAGLKARAQ